MLHDPTDRELFPTYDEAALAELAGHGSEQRLDDGDTLFAEGDERYDFFVVLDGEVQVTKTVSGDEQVLAVHHGGEPAGELSLLAGAPAIATATAVGPVRVLRIEPETFRRLVAEGSPLAEVALRAMVGRTRDVDDQIRQQEKLAGLGRMAAGLAHELNNPAAAARRSASLLTETAGRAERLALALGRALAGLEDPERAEEIVRCLVAVRSRAARVLTGEGSDAGDGLSPLERSSREDEVADFLDDQGVDDAFDRAETLVEAGLDRDELEAAVAELPEDSRADGLAWLAASLTALRLAHEVERASERISNLVGAIKSHSHMDREGSVTDVDVRSGLATTITVLGHAIRDRKVRVTQELPDDLPTVPGRPGQLNQVWANLLENAIHAAGDREGGGGHVTVRARVDRDRFLVVEIEDDGPGIPEEIRDRVFEPFFTTKGVGEGSGLGLEIARRIVRSGHHGALSFSAGTDGGTVFEVCLPLERPEDC